MGEIAYPRSSTYGECGPHERLRRHRVFETGEEVMKRYCQLVRVKPEAIAEYERIHAAVWPGVLDMIRQCNIRNYSIFLRDGTLYSYFEYHGDDFAGDMAKMAADPTTQEWWAIMMPMQAPRPTRAEGEWWTNMEEVFHTD